MLSCICTRGGRKKAFKKKPGEPLICFKYITVVPTLLEGEHLVVTTP